MLKMFTILSKRFKHISRFRASLKESSSTKREESRKVNLLTAFPQNKSIRNCYRTMYLEKPFKARANHDGCTVLSQLLSLRKATSTKAKGKKYTTTIWVNCFRMWEKWEYIFGTNSTNKHSKSKLIRTSSLPILHSQMKKDPKLFFMHMRSKISATVLFTVLIDQF